MESATLVRSLRSLVLVESGLEITLLLRPIVTEIAAVLVPVQALAFVLSDFERRIVDAINTGRKVSSKTLASRLSLTDQDGTPSSKLKGTLGRLTGVAVLSNDDDGYFISPEFRPFAEQLFGPTV